jgi:membrane protease YdiL (CAAX protease family)
VVASLALAAALAPWAYQGGKWLAAMSEVRDLLPVIESLAGSCRRAKLDRYFDRSLLASALLLLPLLMRRIRRIRSSGPTEDGFRLRAVGWRGASMQIAVGVVCAAGLLWVLCLALVWTGALDWKESFPGIGRVVKKAVIPALGAAWIEEWLFRGLLLGLWLRFARPSVACVGSALMFSLLHFLQPPADVVFADPSDPWAGFRLLGAMLGHLGDPRFFITDFATLVVVGIILAWSRLRTGALWMAVGLHAGWIFGFKLCGLLCAVVPEHPLRPWWVGDTLRSGILPMAVLALTALACTPWLRRFRDPHAAL